MSKIFDEIRNEAEKIGEYKRAVKDAERMIATGKLSVEEVSECSGLSVEEVREIIRKKSA